jgi:REP element-mobilizing transposase RayT
LRRLVLSDRYFFVTCKVSPERERLSEAEFALLAGSIHSRRRQHQFLRTGWVFLPDHWHAIIMPPYPSTISAVMESIKMSSTRHINKLRDERGSAQKGRSRFAGDGTACTCDLQVARVSTRNPEVRALNQKCCRAARRSVEACFPRSSSGLRSYRRSLIEMNADEPIGIHD